MLKKLVIITGILAVVALSGFVGYRYVNREQTCTTDCNVLLISVDSTRADHMGAYGYSRNTTPNFDKLAKRGTLFKNYYSTSFLTPVTEAVVQTGFYPSSNGVRNFATKISDDRTTLPEYLKKLGYHNEAIVAAPEFTSYPALKESFSRGYDVYPSAESISVEDRQFGQHGGGYPSPDKVVTALSPKKNSSSPNFVWMPIGQVHWPFGFEVPNVYANYEYKGPFEGKKLDWGLFGFVYNNKLYPSKIALKQEDIQYVRDMYDNGVKAFDDFLGQVLVKLDEHKLTKRTIIIIESEHGEDLGEHGYFAHYDILDTQVHTPLLIVDPRVAGNKQIQSMVGSVDILPTILDQVGTSTRNGLQGKSLYPLITGQEKDNQRKTVFLQKAASFEQVNTPKIEDTYQGDLRSASSNDIDLAIRTEKWKYISRLSRINQEKISWWKVVSKQPIVIPEAELYDLAKDPEETKNVIAEHPGVAADLKKQLNDWYAKILKDVPKPAKNNNILQPYP